MINIENEILIKYSSPACGLLFMYLVAAADDDGRIETSLRDLVSKTQLPINTIRQKLIELAEKNRIITDPNNKGTIITICNFDSYRNDKSMYEQSSSALMDMFDVKYPFEEVWSLYGKKKGNKEKISSKWNKLPIKDKEKALKFIPVYVALTETNFRKMFETFLNQRTWEDDKIYTQGIAVSVASFKARLVQDENLFPQFVERFNMMVAGTKIPQVNMKDGLTEKRRVLFNIAYCLHFHDMKQVMEFVVRTPRYNGMAGTGFVANYDYIFKPENFIKLLEESQN